MQDMRDGADIVGLLREKTEEADLRLCLKSRLGGFTRESVLEYLALMRERQQNAAEIFDQNLKSLFNEKEQLKAENAALKEQLLKARTEYQNLSERLCRRAEPGQIPEESPEELRNAAAAMECELNRLSAEQTTLIRENDELRDTISMLGKNLEHAIKELKTGEELLSREKEESQAQRDKVLELLSTLEGLRSRVKYLEGQLSEQNVTELNAEIAELNVRLRAKTEVVSAQNTDLKARDDTIRSLENENKMLKLNTGYLSKSLEAVSLQNEKLCAANRELTDKLQEEYRRALKAIHEKTDVTVDRLIATQKLEEANARIASLEYQLEEKGTQENELQELRKSCG